MANVLQHVCLRQSCQSQVDVIAIRTQVLSLISPSGAFQAPTPLVRAVLPGFYHIIFRLFRQTDTIVAAITNKLFNLCRLN